MKNPIEFVHLFSPIKVEGLLLKNRLVALPVHTGYAHPDGRVSNLMIQHYGQIAQSGVALVVVGNAAVSFDGVTGSTSLRIDRDDLIPGLSRLAETIKAGGALACIQLNHAGRFARTDHPLLPSPLVGNDLAFNIASLKNFMNFFPFEKRFGLTKFLLEMVRGWSKAMTIDEQKRVIADFCSAALRAHKAGFDMIELHGANGYLLCQFLSSFTNRVPYGSGGDFQARIRFPLSVVKEVKRCLPLDFPIGYRLILSEWVPGGIELPETLDWAEILQREGIAYLSASAGTYNSIFSPSVRKVTAQPAYLRQDVSQLSGKVGIPTVISGRVILPVIANELIRTKVAGLVGLGRPLVADHLWVKKAEGKGKKIRVCINCNWCLKSVVLEQGLVCKQWPRLAQERRKLEHRLLASNYRGLWLVTDREDIALLKAFLPLFLPEISSASPAISPKVLFLRTNEDDLSEQVRNDFLEWGMGTLGRLGYSDSTLNSEVRMVRGDYESLFLNEIEKGENGVLLIGRNSKQPWRERVPYRVRGKVVVMMGSNMYQRKVIVPVDFSPATLLTLIFLRQTQIGKQNVKIKFVHILKSTSRGAETRWKEVRKVVGLEGNIPLQLVTSTGNTTKDILDLVKAGQYGTIVMGKRGLSGIKRWLLGSVSAGVHRGLANESLILID